MKKILFLQKDKDGFYWIHDKDQGILDKDIGPLGPYNSRSEAQEDAEGLTRTILSNPDIWPTAGLVPKRKRSKISDPIQDIEKGSEQGD